MTVTGPEGMKFLESQGATRVVAARELSLEELSAMHQASPIEIEAFIHGALCYSFSGQCLMSSMLGGRSGNRGRCAQPCRLPYQVRTPEAHHYKTQKDFCPLSLKDMCTLDLLPEIISVGVTSLKIEGRMKQPGYTAKPSPECIGNIWIYFLIPAILIMSQIRIVSISLIFSAVEASCQGYYRQSNGPSMMAFTNDKKSKGLPEALPSRKEPVSGTLILYPGAPAMLDVACRDVHITATAEDVQFAKDQPMAEARIRQQMEKLGNTPFVWKSLDIEMGEQIFVPIRVLNELRRNAIQLLEENLYGRQKRTVSDQIRYSTAKDAALSEKAFKFRVPAKPESRQQHFAKILKYPDCMYIMMR